VCREDDTAVVALADDLSGAAEAAALLRLPARLVLHVDDLGVSDADGKAVVVDLDSRYLDDEAAADAVRAAVGCAWRDGRASDPRRRRGTSAARPRGAWRCTSS
jgi:4-hydroxythreonine-4-phosphate dehydrogenase